ncbi:MAG TPA: hypothetical protein PLU22_14385 [Polyangiaceae bacterium]|nr:hypothetical protein [Polyangiaceae bacterium]
MTESPKKRAKATTYLPAPTLPRDLVPRCEAILAALTGGSPPSGFRSSSLVRSRRLGGARREGLVGVVMTPSTRPTAGA